MDDQLSVRPLKFNSLFVGTGGECRPEICWTSLSGMEKTHVNALPPEMTLLSLSSMVPKRPERRDDGREHSLLRIACLLFEDRRELCLIRNISAGGALVRTYSRVPAGRAVALELKQGESVSGVVRWSEGNMIGIMFNHLVDVVALLEDSSAWPRPRQPRVEIERVAWMQQGSQTFIGQALDLSQGGVKLRLKSAPSHDLDVVVTLRGLPPLKAVARWSFGDIHGLEFKEPLPLKTLVQWVRTQQAADNARKAGNEAA